jgi:hypothetical protein
MAKEENSWIRLEQDAQGLSALIDVALNPQIKDGGARTIGFSLVVAPFKTGELTWTTNADKSTMINLLKELIIRLESPHRANLYSNPERYKGYIAYTARDILGGGKGEK